MTFDPVEVGPAVEFTTSGICRAKSLRTRNRGFLACFCEEEESAIGLARLKTLQRGDRAVVVLRGRGCVQKPVSDRGLQRLNRL